MSRPCLSHGCNQVAVPDPANTAQLCIDCWNRERSSRGAPFYLRRCPRGCEGGICKAATALPPDRNGNVFVKPAPPGACAMFGGPVPEAEIRRAS